MESLLLVAQRPLLGQVVPEIAQTHGAAFGVRLYTAFMRDVAATLRCFKHSPAATDQNRRTVVVADVGADDPVLSEVARVAHARLLACAEPTRAQKTLWAAQAEFERGARSVVSIFPETPTLPIHVLNHAFRALLFHPLVVGVDFGGLPYLIGLRRPVPDILGATDWDGPAFFTSLMAGTGDTGVQLMPFWYRTTFPTDLELLSVHARYLSRDGAPVAPATCETLAELELA